MSTETIEQKKPPLWVQERQIRDAITARVGDCYSMEMYQALLAEERRLVAELYRKGG